MSDAQADDVAEFEFTVRRKVTAFGATVRRLRTGAGITIRQLAESSGLAASTISKVENGLMSPTYDNILRLAAGLNLDVDVLVNPKSQQMAIGRRSVTRARQGFEIESRNYRYEMLCSELSHKRFVPLVARIAKWPESVAPELVRHQGEEFIYVLDGEVILFTDVYEPLHLSVGDSCYFDSSMGHALSAFGEDEAHILWISSNRDERVRTEEKGRLAGE